MSSVDLAANPTRHDSSPPLLSSDTATFKENYDKKSFEFRHSLHASGLFSRDKIIQVARNMLNSGHGFTSINFKQASVDGKIAKLPVQDQLTSTIENLNQTGSWIKLSSAQNFDPDYAALLPELLREFESLAGQPLRRDITWASMTLFLSSPGITTPFHIDHGPNFLFQIEGDKQVCVFDAADRELIPYPELENYYFGNGSAANYKSTLQNRGTIYELAPGKVVHHPHLAPHWVKNKDNISISLSVSYCMRPLEQIARIHQANFMLRRFGLKPKPPGSAPRSDALKMRLMSALEDGSASSYHDILYGPVDRLKAPIKRLRTLVRPAR